MRRNADMLASGYQLSDPSVVDKIIDTVHKAKK